MYLGLILASNVLIHGGNSQLLTKKKNIKKVQIHRMIIYQVELYETNVLAGQY